MILYEYKSHIKPSRCSPGWSVGSCTSALRATELTTVLEPALDNVSKPYGRASAKESRTWVFYLCTYMCHGKMGCTSPCLNINFAAMYAATRIGALRASHRTCQKKIILIELRLSTTGRYTLVASPSCLLLSLPSISKLPFSKGRIFTNCLMHPQFPFAQP